MTAFLGHALIWFLAICPALVACYAYRRGLLASSSLKWMCAAYMVSMPGEVARLFGYLWGAEWMASNIYPAVQLSVFAIAVARVDAALMLCLALTFLGSGHVLVNGIAEPGIWVRAVGGFAVALLAWKNDQLRGPIVMYCAVGAIGWILWFPYMKVYGLGAWLGYWSYHLTKLASFGLFIHAAHRWREA